MELPLLVGVDGSEHSLWAVDWAVDAAARHAVPVRLLHASAERTADDPKPGDLMDAAVDRAHQRDPAVRLTTEILAEEPAPALVRAGRNAFAVAVGSRGLGGIAGLLLGSVGLSVAARADCPVIVVRGTDTSRRGGHGRIVLGVG
ncbi:MAG TPA: universal stress protein, partial [Streptomyces sp.]|nr:universal stress protein [Streptomyces sp.]